MAAGKEIVIFSVASQGEGLSGGDRIFIEFARRWAKKLSVTIYVWEEGYQMCQRQRLGGVQYKVLNMGLLCKLGFVICYFTRILKACLAAWKLKLQKPKACIVYSASEFWMDSFSALILKLRYPEITWVAAWYQTAPNPFDGFTEGERGAKYRLSAFLYWFIQKPVKPLISRFADFVLVNNEEERKQFPKQAVKPRTIVVLGAVDIDRIKQYRSHLAKSLPKRYDAVFQGRFHPQKGVVELIDIWKKVVKERPEARLAMIGDGPLTRDVKARIKKYKIEDNVKLFGYLFDGSKKYKIFSQSKVVVHPAFYDSGGMASAEAMVFGSPAVGFDLKSYKSYYPQGMIKVRTGDLEAFAGAVLKLLRDDRYREKIAKEAMGMLESNWSWDKRAREVLSQVLGEV